MSRPLRIEYENAFYHVIARGERRDAIFNCPADKEKFLVKLRTLRDGACFYAIRMVESFHAQSKDDFYWGFSPLPESRAWSRMDPGRR
jgi:hypothetical protein